MAGRRHAPNNNTTTARTNQGELVKPSRVGGLGQNGRVGLDGPAHPNGGCEH